MNIQATACLLVCVLTASAGAAIAQAADKSSRIWGSQCASCHAMDGTGQTSKGKAMYIADMSTPSWQGAITNDGIKKAIEQGIKRDKILPALSPTVPGQKITASVAAVKEVRVKQQMDAYKEKLKPEEIDGLVPYVRQFAK